MSDIEKLEELAKAALTGGSHDGDALRRACRPTLIADLVDEIRTLRGYQQGADVEAQAADEARAEVRRLKAENESLRKQVARLKSENQSLLEDPGSAL